MRYNLSNKIEQVRLFESYNNNLAVINKSFDLILGDKVIANDVRSCNFCANNLIFFKSGISYVYSIEESKIINSVEGAVIFDSYLNNSLVIYRHQHEGKSLYLYKFDCENFTLLKDFNLTAKIGQNLRIGDTFIHTSGKTLLRSLSLHTGTYLWETGLSAYGEIRKIVAVVGERLWVSIVHTEKAEHSFMDIRTNKLLVLDVHTGVVQKEINHDYRFADFRVCYTEEKGTILSLRGHSGLATWIYEYDSLTLEPFRAFEIPSLAAERLAIDEYKILGNNIYFTATDRSVHVPNCIGVMDYYTLELLWYKKLKHSATRLEVTLDKIYFMNQDNTLYIYEREDSETTNPETNLNI